jgi:hypothetical protein
LRGSSAERVAEAKEDRTKQGEGEEDAKDGCGSEGYLAVLFGGFAKMVQIVFCFVSGVHGC